MKCLRGQGPKVGIFKDCKLLPATYTVSIPSKLPWEGELLEFHSLWLSWVEHLGQLRQRQLSLLPLPYVLIGFGMFGKPY